jgi:hypothetical protein
MAKRAKATGKKTTRAKARAVDGGRHARSVSGLEDIDTPVESVKDYRVFPTVVG